jgi:hydrogenase expression/formation protein HypE
VNDLAVCGARPLGIALGLIMAEGFETAALKEIMASVAATADEAGVKVITGDTKVVGRGQADGIYITTAGVGVCGSDYKVASTAEAGDVLIINGYIADHGLAVMLAREMPQMSTPIKSDAAPLNGLIQQALKSGAKVRFMRDATRAGLSGLAADLAKRYGRRVVLDEKAIPVRRETRHAAEMLGLDVLEVANEGKVVMLVAREDADRVLQALQQHPLGKDAAIIGRLAEQKDGICELRTNAGGSRIVQKPYGEQLPRIC